VDTLTANGLVSQVLFSVDRSPSITEPEVAAEYAEVMLEQQYFTFAPADYLEAIDSVLAAGPLTPRHLGSSRRFTGEQLLTFLRNLQADLRGRGLTA
jgi:hypothetical protein